jgi:hypothetical protein
MRSTLRVARYRFRTTFARRRGGYLAIALLIGVIGGLALGAVSGARRTQSSFPAFLESTKPSQLSAESFGVNTGKSASGVDSPTSPATLRALARLPHVTHTESEVLALAGPLAQNGLPLPAIRDNGVEPLGSLDGLGLDQDRITITKGRLADPRRADELVMSTEAARLLGLHVGETVNIGAFTLAQFTSPSFGRSRPHPHLQLNMKLVGVGEFNTAVVEDDIERAPTYLLYTPAFTRSIAQCCSYGAITDVRVEATRYVTPVEAEMEQAFPRGASFFIHETAVNQVKAERSIKPESIALGVFGAIAALAALLIAGQAIARHLRLDDDELHAMRALGAGPVVTSTDGLLGVFYSVVAGALLATAVAVVMSPLWPIGPVRPLYPSRGFAADWTVLAVGAAALVAVLSTFAVALAYRRAPHRVAERAHATPRPSAVAGGVSAAGLPTSAVAGIRLALESRRDSDAVPMRSAIIGAGLALIVVITTVTFGASLGTLVTHPALYGWNWDYMLTQDQGGGNILGTQSAKLLGADRYIAASSGYALDALRIDGQTVPILGGVPHSPVAPPILSGHGFDAIDQIVLGPSTMAALHKRVGDTVEASYGDAAPTRLKIVGTATMPAVGATEGSDLSIGTGAIVSYQLIPATTRDAQGSAFNPSAIFVRFRHGADKTAALRSLRGIVTTLGNAPDSLGTVTLLSVQRPAEIVNYRSMGSTPALLGVALAIGAVFALGLTLIASVRSRRRDLALLKTMGFTRRQLAATVAWQSSLAVGIGVLVGVPLGIVSGRGLWQLFADQLHVVSDPTVPALTITLVAGGAIILANVVAAIPGRQAARTKTAVLLRAK